MFENLWGKNKCCGILVCKKLTILVYTKESGDSGLQVLKWSAGSPWNSPNPGSEIYTIFLLKINGVSRPSGHSFVDLMKFVWN